MRTIIVPDRPNHLHDRKCKQCKRKYQPGEVLLVEKETGRPDRYWHARCIAAIIERAPADRSREAFEELRQRIIDNGSPWGVLSA